MDIFLIGPAASGKTVKAEQILAAHFGVKQIYDISVSQLLVVDRILDTPRAGDILREGIREARIEAVLFDGCITSDLELATAAAAMKEVRVQTGRNILAVYTRQSVLTPAIADVVLRANQLAAKKVILTNEFKDNEKARN